jgi:hypothetical protein
MKIQLAITLAAALAATSAHAQLSQPQNGQLNSQVNSQLNTGVGTGVNTAINTGVNTGVSGALPGNTITNGVGTARTQAPLAPTQPGMMGRTGAAIGTPGVTAPLGTIDNRAPTTALGTTSVTNASGSSLSPATGSSAPLNNGTWGGTGPNNMLTPAASGTAIGTPGVTSGGAATGAASGAPTGR